MRRATFRELLTLAWPITASVAGDTVLGLVDTKLVSGLGARALGGVGIGAIFMLFPFVVIWGVLSGVKIRTANAVGEGDAPRGIRYAQAGLVLALVMGVSAWVFGRDASAVFRAIGVSPEVVPYARDFLAAVTYGSPASFAALALIQHRQGLGDTRTPMFVTLSGNVLNASLGYCLIYGKLGLPVLGVRGGGYATATTHWVEALVLLALFARDVRRSKREVFPCSMTLPRALGEVAQIGLPTGVQLGCEMAAFTTFMAILGSLPAEEIAAHQTSIAIIRTSFLPGFAVAEAGSVLIGQALGRRDVAATGHILSATLLVAGGFMATCGVLFLALGGPIARAFTTDDAVARIVVKLLTLAAVFQVLDAVNIVLRSALRGAKDVKWPMIIGVAVVWTCIPGAAWFLGKQAGMGALGGWYGFVGEATLGAALLSFRWRYGAWRQQYAPKADAVVLDVPAPVAAREVA